MHLWVLGTEEIQEIADGAFVETISIVVEGTGERLSSALKQGGDPMTALRHE
jgi:hypothetical protein